MMSLIGASSHYDTDFSSKVPKDSTIFHTVQNNVDEAVEKLKAQGVEALGLVCHVSNARQRKNLVDTTVQKYGKIDVVVSNAATSPSTRSILDAVTKTALLARLPSKCFGYSLFQYSSFTKKPMPIVESRSRANAMTLSARTPDTTTRLKT
ncbi:hypothetical protein POM88_023336 [Heracleum sosnowskyi]|uniref:Uncharacterized protein n=1 Tax=Heracleum sosnowskyi TaxID=360622 RepID=A0AAD8IIL2_9APIA|nr:hypothetical protein POM88_023336 [Heracleum sosnowskyi]